jgi:hypothetical protein
VQLLACDTPGHTGMIHDHPIVLILTIARRARSKKPGFVVAAADDNKISL